MTERSFSKTFSAFGTFNAQTKSWFTSFNTSGGINEIAADGNGAIVTSDNGRNFEIYVPGASRVAVRLFALSGLCAANVISDGETVALNAENVAPGIYVMKIDSGKDSETRKIVIK